jgi:hypothetical protein
MDDSTVSVHTVTWIIGRGGHYGFFACTAEYGSWCRSECAVCRGECHGYAGGEPHPHPQRDAERCLVVEHLTEGGTSDELYAGPAAPLRSGPIAPEWDGNTWTWRYADEGAWARRDRP